MQSTSAPDTILSSLTDPSVANALLDSLPDAVIFMDEQGNIVLVNAQFETIFGYQRNEILGKQLELLIPEHLRELHLRHREAFIKSPQLRNMGSRLDLYARKKDGTEFVVDISLNPIHTAKGLFVCAAVRDVTMQHRLIQERFYAIEQAKEEDLRRTEEAEEARRIQQEAIDTICHEIRTPLTGLFGAVTFFSGCIKKLAAEQSCCSAEMLSSMQHHLNMMHQCLQQQRVLVDDVLDISKLDIQRIELNPEPVDLEEMLLSMRYVFASQLQAKHLQLNVRMPTLLSSKNNSSSGASKLLVRVDKIRLQQIILNLVSNAVKFTHHGEITIVVSLEKKSDLSDGGAEVICFRVEDTGTGMTKEEMGRLVERYLQASRPIACEFGGSGLGLAISKQLAERMGGQLSIESEKDHGTKVMFSVAADVVLSQQPPSTLSTPVRHQHHQQVTAARPVRVLVVEDNLINQKVLGAYLSRAGHTYQVATNGLEAVSKCLVMDFDLVFMDIEMPVMGGLEATRKIRELERQQHKNQTPIIGLSGNARKEQIDMALASGMNGYTTKPYHEQQIRDILAQYVNSTPVA